MVNFKEFSLDTEDFQLWLEPGFIVLKNWSK